MELHVREGQPGVTLLLAQCSTCWTIRNDLAICKDASNARHAFSHLMHSRRKCRSQVCLPAGRAPYAPLPSADDTAAATAHLGSDSPADDCSGAAQSAPCPGPGERRHLRSIRRADRGGASPPVDRPPAAVAQTLSPAPAMNESVNCTLEAELSRQIVPCGTVLRQPEASDLRVALVSWKVVPSWRFFRGSGMREQNPWSTAAPGVSTRLACGVICICRMLWVRLLEWPGNGARLKRGSKSNERGEV